MKTANVVEVRDLGPLAPADMAGLVKDDARIERMASLLRLYPAISDPEQAELLHFLKKGQQVEIGLVSAREGVADRIARFRKDHRREFQLKPREVAGFFALILLPLLALIWLCMR